MEVRDAVTRFPSSENPKNGQDRFDRSSTEINFQSYSRSNRSGNWESGSGNTTTLMGLKKGNHVTERSDTADFHEVWTAAFITCVLVVTAHIRTDVVLFFIEKTNEEEEEETGESKRVDWPLAASAAKEAECSRVKSLYFESWRLTTLRWQLIADHNERPNTVCNNSSLSFWARRYDRYRREVMNLSFVSPP